MAAVSVTEAAAFLNSEGLSDGGEGQAEPVAVEPTQPQAEPEAEAEIEAAHEADETEAEADGDEEDPKTDEPKKPGRWQKLKAKAAEAETKYAALSKDHHELADHAEYFHGAWKTAKQDLEFAQQELELLREKLGEYNLPSKLSPDTEAARGYARELANARSQLERYQHAEKAQQEFLIQQRASQVASELRAEAEAYGLTPNEVTIAYVHSHQAGRRLTPAQVAANIAKASGLARKAQDLRAQAGNSSRAPKPIKPGASAMAEYAPTQDGMLRYLKDLDLL